MLPFPKPGLPLRSYLTWRNDFGKTRGYIPNVNSGDCCSDMTNDLQILFLPYPFFNIFFPTVNICHFCHKEEKQRVFVKTFQ